MRGGREQRGTALLLVLTGLVVLSLIATAISRQARSTVAMAGAGRVTQEDRAAARTALEIGRAAVRADGNRPRDREMIYAFGAYTLQVQIADEGGLLDLNLAEDRELLDVLSGPRAPADVRAVASAVLDWRDPDDVARADGAEASAYARAGALPPRNGPFLSVVELGSVLGAEPALVARWLPLVSVSEVVSVPDPTETAAEVPSSVSDQDETAATDASDPQSTAEPETASEERVSRVRIVGTAWRGERFAAALMATVTPVQGEESDVQVLEWRYLSLPYGGVDDDEPTSSEEGGR